MVYQSWVVVASLQTVNRFLELITRLGETLNGTPGRLLLYSLLQVDKLFSITETFPAMDGYVGFLPKLLPVQHDVGTFGLGTLEELSLSVAEYLV